MTRTRVACVGTGFIAGRHLAALSGFEDVEVVAVADPVPERAAEVAAAHAARAYPDGLALLEAEELDAVWLCVPPSAHGELEQAAVDRHLPFFVEKPLAVDLEAAVGIARAVQDEALLTCVGYHWRSLGVVERAAAALRDSPAHLVTGTWLDATPKAPWWAQRASSGGQLVEQTTHLFDLVRLLVGEVETVQALELRRDRDGWPGADVPTASAVLLRFASGAVGTMSSSCALDRRHQVGLQITTEGTLVELREAGLKDHELRIATKDGEDVERSDEDPVTTEDRAFVDALRGGHDRVPVPYTEALRTHALVCAADESARSGGTVVDVTARLAALPTGGPRG